ncbi:MAG: hypothetical protein ACK8QZ_08300, partial [Anaerolineales bacterium]
MSAPLILEILQNHPSYQQWLNALRRKEQVPPQGVPIAVRLPLLASLAQDWDGPVLWVTDRGNHALSQREEARLWLGKETYLFAEPTPLFYEVAAWGAGTRRERLQALTMLARYHLPSVEKPGSPLVLFTSVRALMTRTMPRREFLKACKRLSPGNRLSIPSLLHWAFQAGYAPTNVVVEAGHFAHRGGIVDIWPPAMESPLRLDFFGDEIESIRTFDPTTQRTIGQQALALLTPAREYLLSENATPEAFHEFHARSERARKWLERLPSRPATVAQDPLVRDFNALREQLVAE